MERAPLAAIAGDGLKADCCDLGDQRFSLVFLLLNIDENKL
jgi:hypothetical protein